MYIFCTVLPHLADTASDWGAILEFYTLWKILIEEQEAYDGRLSLGAVFFASIFIIIVYKTVSAATVYYITRNPWDILWQYLDVMLVKCVYYGRHFEEPTYLEKYLALMEILFEAAPEMIISVAFMLRTTESIPVIVVLSFLFSLFMLASTLNDEDDLRFADGRSIQRLSLVDAITQTFAEQQHFVYDHDFDENGIVHALGTDFGEREEFQSPAWFRNGIKPIELTVFPKIQKFQSAAAMIGRKPQWTQTDKDESSKEKMPYLTLDFSNSRMRIKPNY